METLLPQVTRCEVCGNESLLSVLDLGMHPMCDDLVLIGDQRVCREYPIEILFCDICRTAHQRFQIPKQQLFPRSYHYRSRFTADVLKGMENLVESCEQKFGNLSGKRILDIGCNDGSLLNIFRNKGAVTIGIEPTDAYVDAEKQGHVTYNNFLSENLANDIVKLHGNPDFIVFTNVFAHIENLPEVLKALRCLMVPDTITVIENHYLGSVLDGNQFDTFYHEHPRTYSYTSFSHIARSLGVNLSDVEFPSRYGGNIRVFLGGVGIDRDRSVEGEIQLEREQHFLEQFNLLRENIKTWRSSKAAIIEKQVELHGRLLAKAFPGRAAILVKLLELDYKQISAVYEKPGSMKIGHYVPGTRVPILSDNELFSLSENSGPLWNLAWHIPKEIRYYLNQNGYLGPVIDIIDGSEWNHANRK